jgi:hypothetical protein
MCSSQGYNFPRYGTTCFGIYLRNLSPPFLYHEHGGSKVLRKTRTRVLNYMVPHPRRSILIFTKVRTETLIRDFPAAIGGYHIVEYRPVARQRPLLGSRLLRSNKWATTMRKCIFCEVRTEKLWSGKAGSWASVEFSQAVKGKLGDCVMAARPGVRQLEQWVSCGIFASREGRKLRTLLEAINMKWLVQK